MTRLSVEREGEIRIGADSGQCPYVGRCNSSRCPKHGGAAKAVRELLAELDAVREELAELKAGVASKLHIDMAAVTDPSVRDASALLHRAQAAEQSRDDLQARLLVMTRERDAFAATVGRQAESLAEMNGEADAVGAEMAGLRAQREELAAALEHLRGRINAYTMQQANAIVLAKLHREMEEAAALPTSEAATTARRGWEAKGIEEARARVASFIDAHADDPEPSDKAETCAYLADAIRSMPLATKRQGGGT